MPINALLDFNWNNSEQKLIYDLGKYSGPGGQIVQIRTDW